MNNNNKILTVSYGTFSCTLEGFDDSFDTMKAIAEYFRDLAADDRYFGAEPPQPDADMLARIAQREVARRVEAHEHDGKIMLKAHQEPVATAAAAIASETVETEATGAAALPEEQVTAPEQDNDAQLLEGAHDTADDKIEATDSALNDASEDTTAVSAEADAPEGEDTPEAPAEEEVVEQEVVEAAAEELVFEDATSSDDQIADDVAKEEAIAEDFADDAAVTEDIAEEDVSAEEPSAEEPLAEAASAAAEEVIQEAQAEASEPEVEEDATDLDDMAAFFAESTTTQLPDMEAEEDIFAAGDAVSTTQIEEGTVEAEALEVEEVELLSDRFDQESLAEKLQRIRAVVSDRVEDAQATEYVEDIEEPSSVEGFADLADAATEELADEMPTADEQATVATEVMAEAAQDISNAFEADDAFVDTPAVADVSEEEDELDAILRRIEAEDDSPENDPVDDEPLDLSAEIDDDEEFIGNVFASIDDPEEDAFDDHDEGEPEVHGRVLKVNRADLEAALEAGDLQEYEEDTAYLLDDSSAADDAAPIVSQPAARESLPDIDSDKDQDLSRLMAEADQQMQEPEGKTRRSAFAHLRAAVAARFADRTMDVPDQTAEQAAEAYRSDLAEVVKPRRPIAKTRSERPSEARPAPLKLVAEQRIDAEAPATRGPVAPRRVAAADDHDVDIAEDTGFATYAEERGAESFSDLLEAAAAYLAHVEGHEQFSRPQLMSRVRQAHVGEFSREDGLRAFGQLLRTGKIEKIKGGRFAASDAISFKPDHRAAG